MSSRLRPASEVASETRLVATASVLNLFGIFGYNAYAASKHAVVCPCPSLRSE